MGVGKLDCCLPSWHHPWPAKHGIMGKIINFRNRRTGFNSWFCSILFVWPSMGCLIILGSSFLICKRISSPNSQVRWEDWMWQCVWNATYFFSLTISIFQRIFLLNLEIYPFIWQSNVLFSSTISLPYILLHLPLLTMLRKRTGF